MGKDFFQITFQQWISFGIGYQKQSFGGQKEINFYLPFCMISFCWK